VAVARTTEPARLAIWGSLIALFATLSYAARLSGVKPPEDALYLWSSAVSGAVQFAFVLGVVLALVAGLPARDYLALHRPASWKEAAALAGGLLVLVWILGAALSPFLDPGGEQGLTPSEWEPSRAAPFAANFLVVGLMAPVVEELTFRGLGFSLLRGFGRWTAILVVGVAFALAHGLVEGFPLLFVFGAGLAYMRERTGSVYPGMIVHAAFNCVVLLASVKFFQESHGSALGLVHIG
jgi:membrane protease YdiL (CAAX protease family)